MILEFRSATSGKVIEIDFVLQTFKHKTRFDTTRETRMLTTDKELYALEKELIKNDFFEEN